MKKISLITILLCTISLSGCMNNTMNNRNDISNATEKDLLLTVRLNSDRIYYNSTFKITAEIKNINNKPVYILQTFDFHCNIYGRLQTPSNTTYEIGTYVSMDPMGKKVILKPGESLITSIPITGLIYYKLNQPEYNWSEYGSHKMQFWYTSIEPFIYSNTIVFTLTKSPSI